MRIAIDGLMEGVLYSYGWSHAILPKCRDYVMVWLKVSTSELRVGVAISFWPEVFCC